MNQTATIDPVVADDILASAREVIRIETAAIATLRERIDEQFEAACRTMLACRGRVVVVGMGKSGHVANKIAATMASTGTPAFFVHPGEACHGDLGMITREDVIIALSNSGETDEVLTMLPVIKRLGLPLIAMTGNPRSTLARNASIHLDASVEEEACPLGLAPTSSTTVALVLGDALAIAMLKARGFTEEDFARSHPAGQLGRRLLLHINDVMHAGDAIPRVRDDAQISEAVVEMSRKGLGMTAIVDRGNRLLGIFTDGDLRRALDSDLDLRRTGVVDVMTRHGKTISPNQLAAEAAHLMEENKIHSLLVVDENDQVVGALNIHDLFKARVL